jgi:hypothetical protein
MRESASGRRGRLRACLKITRGPAAKDFERGQGGEGPGRTGHRASPQRAVKAEPTPPTVKRPAARRVFGEKAGWLRYSSVGDRCGYPPSSRLAIRPFPRKQDPTEFSDRLSAGTIQRKPQMDADEHRWGTDRWDCNARNPGHRLVLDASGGGPDENLRSSALICGCLVSRLHRSG